MLERYKYQDHSNCPRCNSPQEGTTHVLQCKAVEAVSIWNEELESLSQWMAEKHISWDLSNMIINELKRWLGENLTPYHPVSEIAKQAQAEQHMIGWRNFIDGFWSNKFQQCQEIYHNETNCKKSAQLLLMQTQRKIWMIAWRLWTERNTHLHETRKSIHPQDEEHLNDEIAYEHNKGRDSLARGYQSMFNNPLETILSRTLTQKISWLFNIWAAREADYPAYLSLPPIDHPSTSLRQRYIQWKQKIL